MPQQDNNLYAFGEFRLDSVERVLFHGSELVSLTPKALETLIVLVRHSGHVVSKEELMQEVWPDTFVEEGNLNVNISALRKALGDAGHGQAFIETIPRRGYRFVAPIEVVNAGAMEMLIQRRTTTRIVEDEEGIPKDIDIVAPAPLPAKSAFEFPAWRRLIAPLRMALLAALLLVVVAAAAYFRKSSRPLQPAAPEVKPIRLAVLPFANLTGDPNREYFSDGITDEIIGNLGRYSPHQLVVIGRTSVMAYKHTDKSARQIGSELGVDYILEGSVRLVENRARISAELVRVRDQAEVWSSNYEGQLRDVLEIEAEVGRTTAMHTKAALKPPAPETVRQPATLNPEAHDAYLKGIYFWNRRGDDDLDKATQYFQQAIRLDPHYAEPHAGLASTFCLYNTPHFWDTPAEAERALRLDPTLGQAYAARGLYNHSYWHFEAAEEDYQRALELNPGNPTAHHWHATNLNAFGRPHEAVEEMKLAHELDPLSLPIGRDLGMMYYYTRDYDRAIAQFKAVLEMDPHFNKTHCYLGRTYELQGKYELALKEYQQADSNPPSIGDRDAALGRVYARLGRRQDALRIAAELQALAKKKPANLYPVNLYNVASIYLALGDWDKSFYYLDQDLRGLGWSFSLPVDPLFDPLRSDPRYAQLITRRDLQIAASLQDTH